MLFLMSAARNWDGKCQGSAKLPGRGCPDSSRSQAVEQSSRRPVWHGRPERMLCRLVELALNPGIVSNLSRGLSLHFPIGNMDTLIRILKYCVDLTFDVHRHFYLTWHFKLVYSFLNKLNNEIHLLLIYMVLNFFFSPIGQWLLIEKDHNNTLA